MFYFKFNEKYIEQLREKMGNGKLKIVEIKKRDWGKRRKVRLKDSHVQINKKYVTLKQSRENLRNILDYVQTF